MIAWWWLLVAAGVLWSALFVAVLVAEPHTREMTVDVVVSLVTAPLVALTALFARTDTGTVQLSARAVSRFAAQRTGDGRPAWLFYNRGRGILIIRSWKLGSDRPVARVREVDPEWRQVGEGRGA